MADRDIPGHEYDGDSTGALTSRDENAAAQRAQLASEESGGTDTPSSEKNASADPEDLSKAESRKDESASDTLGVGHTGAGGGPKKGRFANFMASKKVKIGSAALGIGGFGIISVFGVLTGPMKYIHLAEVLSQNFSTNEESSSARMQGLFRYVRSGNIGETRLTFTESYVNQKFYTPELAKNGITITPNALTGQVASVTVDMTKHPEYREQYNKGGGERTKAMQRFMANNGLVVGDLRGGQLTGTPTFDLSERTIKEKRSFIKAAVNLENLGKTRTWLRVRVLAKYLDAPSMFNPLKVLSATLDKKAANYVQKKKDAYDKWKKERGLARVKLSPEAQARLSNAKSGLKATTGITLAATTTSCVIREIANDIAKINYENAIAPSARMGMEDGIGVGNQVKYGGVNTDMETLEVIDQDDFDPETQTRTFQAEPLKYEQGQVGGVPLSDDMKTAFDKESNASDVVDWIDTYMLGGAACSGVGVAIQIGIGLTLMVASGGLSAPVSTLASTALGVGVVMGLSALIVNVATDEGNVLADAKGAARGAAMAYGVRAAAGDVNRSGGGIAISEAVEMQQRTAREKKQLEEFQSKSFATRLFDTSERRSLVGSLVQTQTSNPLVNAKNIATNVLQSAPQTAKTIASIATPSAIAAGPTNPYNFPTYGFTEEELSNPNIQDPYTNADLVNGFADTYKDDALKCFGTELRRGTQGLEAVAKEPVIPADEAYRNTDCKKEGNLEWLRVRIFILDMLNSDTDACYHGELTSCENAGINAGTVQSEDGTVPNSGGAAGYGASAEQLEGLPQECKDGTASGSMRLLCVGAKYRDKAPYVFGANHTSGKANSEKFASGATLAVDCSSYVSTAIWDAYGVDMMSDTASFVNATDRATGAKLFERIALSEGKPGDLAVQPGTHIGIILANGQTVLDANTAHSGSPVDDVGIHPWSSTAYVYALRYIGPNAEGTTVQVGGPTTGDGVTTTPGQQNGQGIQLDGIDDLIVSNQFTANRSVIPEVKNIVIHWFVGNNETPQGVANAFSGGTSVQFFVSEDGKIMQLTEFANSKAGHAKNANDWAIGIEIGSPSSNDINYLELTLLGNEKQKQQVIKLTTALAKKFNISNITVGDQTLYTRSCNAIGSSFSGTCATVEEASQFGIVGHYQLQNSKSDPGKTYIKQIQQAVKNNL